MTRAPIAVALDAPDVETAAGWAKAVSPHVAVDHVGSDAAEQLEADLDDGDRKSVV